MSNSGTFATQRSRQARVESRALQPRNVVVTAPQLTASVNDYGPAAWDVCDVMRLSSSGSVNITGFKACHDGRPRLLWNVGSNPIVLINGSTSSVVGNRISLVSDVTLVANSVSVIQYDTVSAVWRVVGQELAGTGTSGQVLTSNGPGTLPTFQAGGGITGFTSSLNTSSPNNTVNASRLLASGGSVHTDLVIQPKGYNGGILGQLPDSTSTGGNKRGLRVVDFQLWRSSASQVASGNRSFIGGGANNTASGTYSCAVAGSSNTANGEYSFSGGGDGNTASGTNSVAVGGSSNTASGARSCVSGGRANTASGAYSNVPGGRYGTTRGLYGMMAIASGRFGTTGDAQKGQYILRCLTTDATATKLTADQGAAGTANQVIIPNNSNYTFVGTASSHRTDSIGTGASWEFRGQIRRGANAAATTLVSSSITEIGKDSGALTWTIALSADTTNGGLAITFTGEASKTIRTGSVVETAEVTS